MVTGLLTLGLTVHLGLHFFEPKLALTWSYAHLSRHPALPWIGAALVLLLPIVSVWAWRRPAAARAPRPLTWRIVVAIGLPLAAVLIVAGLLWPNPPISVDPLALVLDVKDRSIGSGRRLLLVWLLWNLWALIGPLWGSLTAFLRSMDALLTTGALLALVACAHRLGRTRGEVAAIALLAWTAFGTFQLGIGYLEVYPAELAATALFVWLGLRSVDGDIHPAWPVVVAALAPFWYVTLILLAPALAVIAWLELRRPGGFGRLALSAVLAIAAAGLATVPGIGRPFAWSTLVARVAEQSAYQSGYSSTSSLLPLDYILSWVHARELVHILLLVDGVGVLLVLVAGAWLLARRRVDARALFLAVVIASHLPYLVAFDGVFGAFCDWDLFSYLAVPTSLLGGYAFVQWGREAPKPFAALLGLALAANGVHLLARLNALHIELPQHRLESPYHMP